MTPTRRALAAVLDAAPLTGGERRACRRWYPTAGRLAHELAQVLDVDDARGAGVLAAFSIRTPWDLNRQDAWAYATGRPYTGLTFRATLADRVIANGLDALRGPKVNAFARAIAGDESAVTVDVWLCRAAGLDRSGPTIRQYRQIVADVTALAPRYGESPRTIQTILWARTRGSLT